MAHIAWVCTVIVVAALLLLAVPGALRRLTRSGDRAPMRTAILMLVILLGVAVEAALDKGLRPIGGTYAHQTSTLYADVLQSPRPFPIDSFYALRQSLAGDRSIVGSIPELKLPGSWMAIRTRHRFKAPALGIATSLTSLSGSNTVGSHDSERVLVKWQGVLARLFGGRSYVDQRLARSEGIRKGDYLFAKVNGHSSYVLVSGVSVQPGPLLGHDAVLLPLAFVQGQFGFAHQISRVEILFTSSKGSEVRLQRRRILASAGSIPAAGLSKTAWAMASTVNVPQSGDGNRWLAVAAACLVAVLSLVLRFMGWRKRPRRPS